MKALIEVDPNRLVGVLNLAAMALADPQNKDAFLDDFDAVTTARNEAKRWHKYPETEPQSEGAYLVALDFPDGDFCVDTGGWDPEMKRWIIDEYYADDEVNPLDAGSVVKAWMPKPEFPRKLIWG